MRAEGRHFPEGADEGAEKGAGAPLRKSPQRFQVDSEPTSAFSSLSALMRRDFSQIAGQLGQFESRRSECLVMKLKERSCWITDDKPTYQD